MWSGISHAARAFSWVSSRLVREIKEELDAEISVGKLIQTVEWDYPNFIFLSTRQHYNQPSDIVLKNDRRDLFVQNVQDVSLYDNGEFLVHLKFSPPKVELNLAV